MVILGRLTAMPLFLCVSAFELSHAANTWQGVVGGNWSTESNWSENLPGQNSSVFLTASGDDIDILIDTDVLISDLSMDSDPETGRTVTLTVKNGGTLTVTPRNLDLGYNARDGKVLLRIEAGAVVRVQGYVGRALSGSETLIDVAGTLEAGQLYNEAGNHLRINLEASGKLIVGGVYNRRNDVTLEGDVVGQIEEWAVQGLIRDRGVDYNDPRWGSDYGIRATYDPAANCTIVTSIAAAPAETKP